MSAPLNPSHDPLSDQARQLEDLLPRLNRRLFEIPPGDPTGDLPLAQLRVCAFLLSGPSGMTALAEELEISVSAATQLADRLERAGLIQRISDPIDRRIRHISLTEHGVEVMETRRRRRVSRVREALAQLDLPDRAAALSALTTLLDATRRLPTAKALHEDSENGGKRV
ncbi:MarR family transcriptional regulator [Capsulimonas corticalis]|uniref:MarR family transcriptional regulator n=1 Tax=Capsulimonas corticalis TaxID=2219043 RepID=A0A402CWQ6_9BACT|nr:MarR family transcriptional regulator [Capsulimonas corticalis]BDI34214.1 MarR family transcriptional regulator [Capsulimonas corticalis]